jgi:hypothetical protein
MWRPNERRLFKFGAYNERVTRRKRRKVAPRARLLSLLLTLMFSPSLSLVHVSGRDYVNNGLQPRKNFEATSRALKKAVCFYGRIVSAMACSHKSWS